MRAHTQIPIHSLAPVCIQLEESAVVRHADMDKLFDSHHSNAVHASCLLPPNRRVW